MVGAGLAAVTLAIVILLALQGGGASQRRPVAAGTTVLSVTIPPVTQRTSVVTSVATPTRPPTTRVAAPTTTSPCSGPNPKTSQPQTGTDLRPRKGSGDGALTVSNGLTTDAVVKVVSMDTPPTAVLVVYVRASESFTILGIPRRTYRIVFGKGSRWSDERQAFACPAGATEFADPVDFSSDWGITLNPVTDGKAKIDSISQTAFESL